MVILRGGFMNQTLISEKVKRFVAYMLLSTWGGYIYVVIELLFRQKSDITMMFCASICVLPMILLNDIFSYEFDFILQLLYCAIYSTITEYFFGIIFNIDHSIWDYSNMPFNFQGQICLPFFFVWMLISVPVIIFDDWIEYRILGVSGQPYYKICGKEIYRLKE